MVRRILPYTVLVGASAADVTTAAMTFFLRKLACMMEEANNREPLVDSCHSGREHGRGVYVRYAYAQTGKGFKLWA